MYRTEADTRTATIDELERALTEAYEERRRASTGDGASLLPRGAEAGRRGDRQADGSAPRPPPRRRDAHPLSGGGARLRPEREALRDLAGHRRSLAGALSRYADPDFTRANVTFNSMPDTPGFTPPADADPYVFFHFPASRQNELDWKGVMLTFARLGDEWVVTDVYYAQWTP
jgi:hypothetical protein